MDPELTAIIEDYARTHGLNLPPHQIVSDPLAQGTSGIELLLTLLGMAANMGDPADNTEAQTGQAERDAKLTDAELKFPANEEESAAQLAAVGAQDPMSQMSGLTQGIGQGIAGAVNGLLRPFSELGQELPQLLQSGVGAMQQGADSGVTAAGEAPDALLGGGLGAAGLADAVDDAGAAGAAGAAGLAGTIPAGDLGPAPIPAASTVPASSPATVPAPAPVGESAGASKGGMAGMPMMPPGVPGGVGGTPDGKADTKRVVPPAVKNGAPVQGRVTAPPATPTVTKHVQGKPVSVRRVVRPGQGVGDDADSGR